MDAQIKKGLLDVCVLACLVDEDNYGYQIIKDVNAVVAISEGTLYPVLKRLEHLKFLTTYEIAYNGRLRKYFKITENGMQKLKEFDKEQEGLIRVYEYISSKIKSNGKGGSDE